MNTSQFLDYLGAHPATSDLAVEVTDALALRRRPSRVADAGNESAPAISTRIAS